MPREKAKLLPSISTEKPQPSTTAVSPDSIEQSTSSTSSASSSTAAVVVVEQPTDIPSKVLPDETPKPLPPTHLEIIPDKAKTPEEKSKESPVSVTDHDEDTSEIKTPSMTPRSPVAPAQPVLELNVPPAKPLSGKLFIHISIKISYLFLASQSTDLTKRTQYYKVNKYFN